MQPIYERRKLSAAVIDDFSERISELLMEHGLTARERLRLRLAAEETMLYWMSELGECPCSMRLESRFGRS